MESWKPYTPTRDSPWNVQRVVRLHIRAGFAATWQEVEQSLKHGPVASIERLLAGKSREGFVREDYSERAARLEELAIASNRPADLRAAWIYRMSNGPDALGERLTLMWHNHFATSNEKVRDFRAMVRQNAIFREFGRAPFGEMLIRLSRDPALLVYLDAQVNRKEHPNENLARELMELFTLGVGNYSEGDVRQAARSLTGWTTGDPQDNDTRAISGAPLEHWIRYSRAQHDDGEKTVLGRRGRWSGEDLVKILLDQPATASRLAWRIASEFLGEGVATKEELSSLAEGLRATGLDVGKAVQRVLFSERLFAIEVSGRRVTGPVEWAVAAARRFLPLDPPPSPVLLGEWAARMGQSLYYPPNVGGWPGGRTWISPLAMLGRANLAGDLVAGRLARPAAPPMNLLGLIQQYKRAGSRQQIAGFLSDLILGSTPGPGWTDRVVAAAGELTELPEFARRAAAVILASPEAQLS